MENGPEKYEQHVLVWPFFSRKRCRVQYIEKVALTSVMFTQVSSWSYLELLLPSRMLLSVVVISRWNQVDTMNAIPMFRILPYFRLWWKIPYFLCSQRSLTCIIIRINGDDHRCRDEFTDMKCSISMMICWRQNADSGARILMIVGRSFPPQDDDKTKPALTFTPSDSKIISSRDEREFPEDDERRE